MKEYFLLRPDITYLNFGAFGACVKPVFEQYQAFQLELEQEPTQFITINGPVYLQQSKVALGKYIGADPHDLVYAPNPSQAANIVAKSLKLQPGDEVLSTDIEYGACDRTWDFYCKKAGGTYKRQTIKLPVESKEAFIQQFIAGMNERTRLVFISHITSSTGLRLPAEEICAIAKERGILTMIDGAHAPGQLPLDIQSLPVDFYIGACHKWMMTPKGSSFLYARKEIQSMLEPLIVGWGYNAVKPSASQFLDYQQVQGTRDYSAYLTIPKAIEFMEQHNWWQVAEKYRKLTIDHAAAFSELLNTKPIAPLTNEFILQLYSANVQTNQPEKLKQHLFNTFKIEIPVMQQNGKVYLRYSLNAFNSQQDMDRLFDAITQIKKTTSLIEV